MAGAVVFVLGTRAQLVKVAPVLREAVAKGLPHDVWFTGQHRETIQDLVDDFALESEFVMPKTHRERSSVGGLAVWLPATLLRCWRYLRARRVHAGGRLLVVVHGDTLSTFLGALAAKMARCKVVHLESGLTSGSMFDPFPEEILRRLTFRMTDTAFCPNDSATKLMSAYCTHVVNTRENTLLDSVRFALLATQSEALPTSDAQDYFVASLHRFGNLYANGRLEAIVEDLRRIAKIAPVVFVLHPATRKRLDELGLSSRLQSDARIRLTERMNYSRFLTLLAGAKGVFSDGGSNQEELAYLGIPAVLYRRRSERPDGLGANARLESEVGESVPGFVESGALEALRGDSKLRDEVYPSASVVEELLASIESDVGCPNAPAGVE